MAKYINANELHKQGWVAVRLETEVRPLIDFPAAGNVREMVYCEDCKWGEFEEYNGKYYCVYHGVVGRDKGFYCRDGKWREE